MPSAPKKRSTESVAAVISARPKAASSKAATKTLSTAESKTVAAPTRKAVASAAPKRAAASATTPALARKAYRTQYGKFSAALRQIDMTIDEIRVMNDRAAKRLA